VGNAYPTNITDYQLPIGGNIMVDMTQLTGSYAASWLPWIMIPLIFYILPFPVFALIFIWIEKEVGTADEEV
jgi:photosystem I subunit VIII